MNKPSPALATLRKAAANAGERGFHREAEALALRALEVAQSSMGIESQDYFECAIAVVSSSHENGNLIQAQTYQCAVIELARLLYGNAHTQVALQLRVLADLLRESGQELEARRADKEAASIISQAHAQFLNGNQSHG